MRYINQYAFSVEMEESIHLLMAIMINMFSFKLIASGTSFAPVGDDLESLTHRGQDKWQKYPMEKEARETLG